LKRITRVEEKPTDYADGGADIKVDAVEPSDAMQIGKASRQPWRDRAQHPKRRR